MPLKVTVESLGGSTVGSPCAVLSPSVTVRLLGVVTVVAVVTVVTVAAVAAVAPDAADCKIKNKKNGDRMGKKQKREMLKKYV
jgi:hypothetical protein